MLITDTVRGSSLSEDDALHSLDDVFGDSVEPSDIPRLRSIHVTNGYREGIAEGKERSVQAGFDEGYSLGAEFGMTVGWILGVLEALQLVKKDDQTMKLLENAKTELDLANLFNEHYFDDSGIWKYDVDATIFREIAAAHPILKRWKENVIEKQKSMSWRQSYDMASEEAKEDVMEAVTRYGLQAEKEDIVEAMRRDRPLIRQIYLSKLGV